MHGCQPVGHPAAQLGYVSAQTAATAAASTTPQFEVKSPACKDTAQFVSIAAADLFLSRLSDYTARLRSRHHLLFPFVGEQSSVADVVSSEISS